MYSDASCGEWVAHALAMRSFPDLRRPANLTRKMRQTVFDFDNWWTYERSSVRAMIDRTEQMRGAHFVPFFASLQTTDVAFFDYVHEHFAAVTGAPTAVRNVLELLEERLPAPFAACCACDRAAASPVSPVEGAPARRPCYLVEDLWSSCFRAHATDAQARSLSASPPLLERRLFTPPAPALANRLPPSSSTASASSAYSATSSEARRAVCSTPTRAFRGW
jgi:hypothetical protein